MVNETTEKRIALLKACNDLILDTGDEDIFERWFMIGIPDGATESDYREIASYTDSFREILDSFIKIYE